MKRPNWPEKKRTVGKSGWAKVATSTSSAVPVRSSIPSKRTRAPLGAHHPVAVHDPPRPEADGRRLAVQVRLIHIAGCRLGVRPGPLELGARASGLAACNEVPPQHGRDHDRVGGGLVGVEAELSDLRHALVGNEA